MADSKVASYIDRGIKIEQIIEGVPINVFEKMEHPISIKLEKDTLYLKKKTRIEYFLRDTDYSKSKIITSIYLSKLASSLKSNFISTDSTVYGFFKEEELFVYDFMTNSNFFPYCDLEKIEKDFNYLEYGFKVMRPILSGYKKSEDVVKFISKYLTTHPTKKSNDFFILPAYPEVSSTTYYFYDEILHPIKDFDAKEDTLVEVFVEVQDGPAEDEKLEMLEVVDVTSPLTYDEKKDELENIIKEMENDSNVLVPQKKKESFTTSIDIKNKEVIKTLGNLRFFYSTLKRYNETEKTLLYPLAILWTIWSKSSMMGNVYEAMLDSFNGNKLLLSDALVSTPEDVLSSTFFCLWQEHEWEIFEKFTKTEFSIFTTSFLKEVLEDEFFYYLAAFDVLYLRELM